MGRPREARRFRKTHFQKNYQANFEIGTPSIPRESLVTKFFLEKISLEKLTRYIKSGLEVILAKK